MAVQPDEGRQAELHEEGSAIGIVHVTGPGIPPRATAVEGRAPRPLWIEPALHQALGACFASPAVGAVAFSRTGDPATGYFGDAQVIRK